MITLYVVRHGETAWNSSGRIHGITDIPLSPTGIQQAEELRDKLKFNYQFIASSTLSRALETGKILNKRNAPLLHFEGLMERDYGKLEGLVWNNLEMHYPTLTIEKEEGKRELIRSAAELKVEDWDLEFSPRVHKIIKQIPTQFKGTRALVTAHGGTIHALLGEKYSREEIPNCSVFEFHLENDEITFHGRKF